MELKKYQNQKFLRCGYTTGSCAAAAAKAAALMLLTGERSGSADICTPRGITLTMDVTETDRDAESARCAVIKDSGDDPDVTDGVRVYAEVRRIPVGIVIDGGEGVGRVTKPGLDQPVGAAAINSVPREMISREVSGVCDAAGYTGGLSVIISIPGGAELAARTFNPRLGIEGGLSVLGTSGIVEPMSDAALIDTVRLELQMLAAEGLRSVLLTIGNYGETFAARRLGISRGMVKCSNFLGSALDAAVLSGFTRILVIGHIGKLVKLGIGMTNTHSSNGDGRMETLAACALSAGAPLDTLREILNCVTTDAALTVLRDSGYLEGALAELGQRIDTTLRLRRPDTVDTGFICFSGDELLIQSENAEELKKQWYIL